MAEIDFKKIVCSEAGKGCTVSVDGKCLEGRPLSECTNHRPRAEAEQSNENVDEKNEATKSEIFEDAHLGDALALKDCRSITAKALTRLIVLAGSIDAGKTTLLASLFELFQNSQSFAGYTFAGSQTLIGFEKRCHESRVASERDKAKTVRTTYLPDDPQFLHLKTRNSETGVLRNLLFTDISGEHFRQLSNSAEECRKFVIGKRADHFALFVDADVISDLKSRQTAKASALSILRGLSESGTLSPSTIVEVIFSRWDLLEAKKVGDKHRTFIDSIKNEIKLNYPADKWNIRFFEVASRPEIGSSLTFGHGIEELLKIWTEEGSDFLLSKRPIPEKYSSDLTLREYLIYQSD